MTGTVNSLHHGQLGSVVLITNSAGSKAQDRGYRPFGGIAFFESSYDLTLAPEAKGFIGERFHEDAGLQYLNARYDDPELGMFTQPDWFEVTMNTHLSGYRDAHGNDMVPRRINSGIKIRANFSRTERLGALAAFYRGPGAKYGQAARDFFAQHPGL